MGEEPSDDELRVRYLDWCSAQVAKRFLELPPEEVWSRAHMDGDAPPQGVGWPLSPGTPSYWQLVQRLTLTLADELSLPPFPEWAADYRLRPERYEPDLIGFTGGVVDGRESEGSAVS